MFLDAGMSMRDKLREWAQQWLWSKDNSVDSLTQLLTQVEAQARLEEHKWTCEQGENCLRCLELGDERAVKFARAEVQRLAMLQRKESSK